MADRQHPDNASASKPALFLDLKGLWVESAADAGAPGEGRPYPDIIPALLTLQEHYLLFVVTLRPETATDPPRSRTDDGVDPVLSGILSRGGVKIQEWVVCLYARNHHVPRHRYKDGRSVRQMAEDYGLDLQRSFVIGGHSRDVRFAEEIGACALHLLTGEGGRHLTDLPADTFLFHRFADASAWVLRHPDYKAALKQSIDEAVRSIRGGGVAAFPTETVYGLGADVFQPDAVAKIFQVKGRPQSNPLIAHIADAGQVALLASVVPDAARCLMDAFWPGPLTLVLPKQETVPDVVTGGLPTVGIRMPAQPIALDLIRRCGTPLAAPSANRFTCTSPTTATHVNDQLGDRCPVVIDGGACRVGVESTVVSFADAVPVILRPGGIPNEAIAERLGCVNGFARSVAPAAPAESPGMMPNHYAPATKLSAYHEIPEAYRSRSDVGIILFRPSTLPYSGVVEILSGCGDAQEAAANFFAAVQRLDCLDLREIVVEYAPDHGLGRALNNRLSKAANGRIEC